MPKKRVLFSGHSLDSKSDLAKWSCGNCKKVVGTNSIYCSGRKYWAWKCFCGIKEKLVADQSYEFGACLSNINAKSQIPSNIVISDENLLVVGLFSCLQSVISILCKVRKSSKIGQDQKTLISTFA